MGNEYPHFQKRQWYLQWTLSPIWTQLWSANIENYTTLIIWLRF